MIEKLNLHNAWVGLIGNEKDLTNLSERPFLYVCFFVVLLKKYVLLKHGELIDHHKDEN